MNAVRILLGRDRSAVADDHLWLSALSPAGTLPATLDSLPAAEHYTVIAPPERIQLCRLTLPPGAKRKALAALPYLIEDRLIEPLEHYEFFPLTDTADAAGAAEVWLAVIERDWLTGVRAALSRITRGEVRWVMAGWGWTSAPRLAGEWRIRLEDGRPLLSRDGPELIALKLADLEAGMSLALGSENKEGPLTPRTLTVDPGTDPSILQRLAAWAAERGISVVPTEYPDVWHADYSATPWSLLQQNRSALKKALGHVSAFAIWLPLAWLVGGLVVFELLASLTYWATLERRVAQQRSESVEIFRAVAPAGSAVIDPVLQLRRLYQAWRHADSKTSPDDFLPLLATVTDALTPNIGAARSISYEGGRLRLSFDAIDPKRAAQLALAESVLRERGWQVISTASADQRQTTLQVSR